MNKEFMIEHRNRNRNRKGSSTGIDKERVEHILSRIPSLKAGVIGDVCLDIYWEANMELSELSRETPHHTLPITNERYSPGAAGNVASNLKAIGCEKVYVCSIFGEDWRGMLLKKALTELDIDLSYSLTDASLSTPTYCKPIRVGLQNVRQEEARLDFHNYADMQADLVQALVNELDQMAEQVDIIAVTDQLKFGIVGDAIRDCLRRWVSKGKIVLVDSRERIHLFHGMIIKPNEVEATNCYNLKEESMTPTRSFWRDLALRLSSDMGAPCVITLGGNGSIWAANDDYIWTPALPASPPLDIVGAGDAFASALLVALGAGSSGEEAMAFAHYASAVSIRKIGTTGTASPHEIITLYEHYEEGAVKQLV